MLALQNKMARQHIPNDVKLRLLVEAGYRCAVPTCRTILTLDLHHIIEVTEGGGNQPDNLICLCPNCHALYHRQKIPQEAIRMWKMILISLNNAFDRDQIDYLLMLHKIESEADEKFRFVVSGDGLLQFKGIFNAGFLNVLYDPPSRYGHEASYIISLSENGNAFVNAWKSGKTDDIKDALSLIQLDNDEDGLRESEQVDPVDG